MKQINTQKLAFTYFGFELTWWRLFQKRVVYIKFDIWVFIVTSLELDFKCYTSFYVQWFDWFGFMVFNATFNNISVISWRSVFIGGGNRSTL